MADNTTTIGVNVVTKGLNEAVDASGNVAKNLKAAAEASKGIRVPLPTQAARAGVANAGGQQAADSNTSRGISGATGASARDFAAQAQGLGGLVHVYATFAANLYAVGAAFNALSKAADTANLVKGLDQIGAATGRGLGTLAKQLSEVTDGAINLRDAMTATALASAGGLTSQAILRMGNVARNASQALGVSMPDAINRISKGIVKLQPELLDELGIMTRVDTATSDYAKSVGKSTLALSSFEKRQAFANAVLKEGEEKFGAISLAANPYQKILASVENLAQSSLELVNKGLGPLINALASSPTALAVTLAGIGTLLLKQAIPALGQYRNNLKLAVEESRDKLAKLYKDQQTISEQASIDASARATLAFRNAADTQRKIAELSDPNIKFTKGTKVDYTALARKNALDITREELKQLDNRANYLANRTSEIQKQEGQVLKLHLADIKAIRQASDDAGSQAEAIKDKVETGKFSHATQLQKAYTKATQEATRDRILASVAETAATEGPVKAFRKLKDELQNQDVGNKFSKGMTVIKGSLSIATAAVNTFINAFSGWIQIIGLVIVGIQLLDSWASKNTEQVEATTTALASLHAAGETVDRTLENISKKTPLGSISTESINAKANALMELSSGFSSVLDKLDKEVKSANIWDSFKDKIASLFNKDNSTIAAKELASSISKAFQIALPGKAKESAKQGIINLLGIDPSNTSALVEALSKDMQGLGNKASAILTTMSTEMSIVASKAKDLDDAFVVADKAYNTILTSSVPTDNLAKLGIATLDVARGMAKAFEDPATALSNLAKIAGDLSKLKFIDPANAEALFKLSPAITQDINKLIALKNAVEITSAAEQEMLNKRLAIEKSIGFSRSGTATVDRAKAVAKAQNSQGVGDLNLQALKSNKQIAESAVLAQNAVIDKYTKQLGIIQSDTFNRGATLLKNSIMIGFEEASISIQKTLASLLPSGNIGSVEENARVQKLSLDLQMRQIDAQISLIDNTHRLMLAQEEANIIAKRKETTDNTKLSTSDKTAMFEKLNTRELALNILKANPGLFGGAGGLTKAINVAKVSPSESAIGQATQLELPSLINKTAAFAAKAKVQAEETSLEYKKQNDLLAARFTIQKDNLATEGSNLALEKAKLDNLATNLSFLDEITQQKKNQIELDILANKAASDQIPLIQSLAQQGKALSEANSQGIPTGNIVNSILATYAQLNNLKTKQANDVSSQNAAILKDDIANSKKAFDYEQALNKLAFDKDMNRENTLLSLKEEEYTVLTSLAILSSKQSIIDKASIDKDKEALRSKQAIFTLESERAAKQESFNSRIRALGDTPDQNAVAQIVDESNAYAKFYNTQIENEKRLSAAKLYTIGVQEEMNILLDKQADIMSKYIDITTNLGTVFGKVGTAIGKAAEGFQTLVANQEKYSSQAAEIDKQSSAVKSDKSLSPEEKAKQLQKLEIATAKLKEKNFANQLNAIGAIASASKQAFGESTKQYKVLAATEKAAALVSTGAAIAKLVEQSGWFGFAGAGALIAILASYGITGGGSGIPSGGFDAKAQQDVQGTGQSFDAAGNITNSRGGVLGDSTAKAKSVDDSISQIEKHSFKTLEYSNKMLDSLKSIKTNTDGLTDALIRGGYTTNNLNANGTIKTGTSGTMSTVGNGTGVGLGSKGDAILANAFQKTIGGIFGSSSGISTALTKINNSIFGGKTNTTIEDTGIQINGMISDIAKSAEGLVQQYTNIKSVTSGGWFRSDKTNLSQDIQNLDSTVNTALEGAFTGIIDTVKASSDALGKDNGVTTSLINGFNIALKISAQGLKPEELAAAINAQLSVAFNQLAETVFPELTRFQKAGEEMGTTVVRLARDMQVTSLALEAAGLNFNTSADLVTKVDVTESLIALAGGLDQFVTQTDYFKQNFLTAAQQLEPVQKRVTAEMTRLGFASINTREGFANLVKGLDLTDPAQQATYASLLNVAEGFATVYPAIEDTTTSLADLVKQGKALQDQINKLTMSQADYRLTQIKGMGDLQIAQYDANVALQLQIDLIGKKNILTGLDVDLLNAQGKTLEATKLARERELAAMDPALRGIQELTNARKDEITVASQTTSLLSTKANQDIELLNAQGKALDATTLSRQREMDLITDAGNKAIQDSINKRKDEIATAAQATSLRAAYDSQDIELLNAQGNAQGALTLTRERELALITDPANNALQQSINIRKDEIASITQATGLKTTLAGLDVDLLTVQGRAADATALSRQRELDVLLPENRAIQELINARKDEITAANEAVGLKTKIAEEEINVLNAQGRSAEALTLTRIKEISALNPTNRGLQQQIYILQDLAKAITDANQNLLDIESEFKSLQDAAKTAADNLDSAIQTITDSFNTAVDNLKTANDNLASARKNIAQGWTTAKDAAVSAYVVVSQGLVAAQGALDTANGALADASSKAGDELRSLAKNIRDFLKSLQTTDLGANNPTQQLAALKNQFASDVSLAQGGDKDALGRVTNTAQSLLTLAKTQSRTSLEYARTVGSVSSTLDALASSTEGAAANAKGDPKDVVIAVNNVEKWQKALYELQVRVNAKYGAVGIKIAQDAADTAASQNDPVVAALDSANAALDNLAKYDTAMAKSGASTDSLTSDLLDEFNAATSAQIAAQGQLDLWQSVVAKAGINTALYTGSIEKTTAKAYDDYVKAKIDNDIAQKKLQRATDLIGTDIISGFSLLADPLTKLNELLTAYITNSATIATGPQLPKSATIDSKGLITGKTGLQGTVAQAKAWFDNAIASGMSDSDLYAAVTGQGISSAMADTILGLSSGTALKWATDRGFPAFAKGGFHAGGLALVGEQGPEVVNMGPAQVFSNKASNDLFNNDALIAEIKALKDEVAALRYTSEQSTIYNKKIRDTLVRVSRDGESLQTVAA